MRSKRASQVEELFLAAVDMPEDEQRRWLVERCGADGELLAQVEQLLAAEKNQGAGFLGHPLLDFVHNDVPRRVGSYEVQVVVGEGGMGEVYAAVHGPTGRKAAVKLLRTGIGARKHLERFRIEAETLGRLNETGIAQLYDAGIAEIEFKDGAKARRPFIAMEFVPGRTITEDARSRGLNVPDRLGVMEQVARSVQYAHMRGVIHRDLKPGNILVTTEGVPKIVDFGVARLMDASEAGLTVTGQVLGTVRYMSPEQAAGDLSRVDTRTDVYSLGAILYELLADRPLIESDTGSRLGVVAQVMNAAPPRLGSIRPELAGDIEAIVGKAIERDQKLRYQSAGELADDLRRVLNGEQVVARSPTTIERFVRVVNRNRPLSTAIGVAAMALVGGAGISVWQATVARGEARRANEAAADANLQTERANEEARRANEKAEEADHRRLALESGREGWGTAVHFLNQMIATTASSNPSTREAILGTLGQSLATINESTGPVQTRVTIFDTASEIYDALGDRESSLALRRRSLDMLEREAGPDNHSTLMERAVIALMDPGDRSEEALKERVRVLRECREKLLPYASESDAIQIRLGQGLALALDQLGRNEESEQIYKRLIEVVCGKGQDGGQLCAHIGGLLGVMYLRMGRLEEAEPLIRANAERLVSSGVVNAACANWLDFLGTVLDRMSKDDQAREAFIKTLGMWRSVEGDQGFGTAKAMLRLASTHRKLGENDDAAALYEEAQPLMRRYAAQPETRSSAEPQLISLIGELARIYLDEERLDDAEPLAAESLRLVGDKFTWRDLPRYRAHNNMALLHLKRGEFVQAESILLEMYKNYADEPAKSAKFVNEIASELVQVYEGMGRADDARTWNARISP